MLLIKTPLVGVLVYGIAEASTAYLITKITEPVPPPPGFAAKERKHPDEEEKGLREWCESQIRWKNKQKFLSLPVGWWDKFTGEGADTGDEFVQQQQPLTPRAQGEGEIMRYKRQFPGGYVSPSDRVDNEEDNWAYARVGERGFGDLGEKGYRG